MKLQDFSYKLPPELIAKNPLPNRSDSKLLRVSRSFDHEVVLPVLHSHVRELAQFLEPGDLLVANNSRVIPARLLGKKESGGQVEVLVERVLNNRCVLAHVRASKSPKPGQYLHLENKIDVQMLEREGDLFKLEFSPEKTVFEWLELYGHMPLPPYIDRPDTKDDQTRYQTIYHKTPGSVAAPTAGLHFDQRLLESLSSKNIEMAFITLHVGAGTFQPVRTEDITQHQLHYEWVEVSETVCEKIAQTKARGGRVIAVGTTAVRGLETAARANESMDEIKPYSGETNLFIYPGYSFRVVDGLLTNFHLPESSLLMLVCAFSGYKNVMHAYKTAIEHKYRFYSYGDAMLIT